MLEYHKDTKQGDIFCLKGCVILSMGHEKIIEEISELFRRCDEASERGDKEEVRRCLIEVSKKQQKEWKRLVAEAEELLKEGEKVLCLQKKI